MSIVALNSSAKSKSIRHEILFNVPKKSMRHEMVIFTIFPWLLIQNLYIEIELANNLEA